MGKILAVLTALCITACCLSLPCGGVNAKAESTSFAYTHYTFDADGTDSGTTEYNGTLTGIGDQDFIPGRTGQADDKSVVFNGMSYMAIDAAALAGTSSFTISYWTKMTADFSEFGKNYRIVSTGFWGGGEKGIMLGVYNHHGVDPQVGDFYYSQIISGVGSSSPVFQTGVVEALMMGDDWHQTIGVFDVDNKTVTVYLDGRQTLQYTYTGDASTETADTITAIGGYLTGGVLNEGYRGALDDMYIIRKALTAEEAADLYTGEFVFPQKEPEGDPSDETNPEIDDSESLSQNDPPLHFSFDTSGSSPITAVEKGKPAYIDGRSGKDGDKALQLDGNSYLELNTRELIPDGSFTLAVWFNLPASATAYNRTMRILSTGVWGAGEGGIVLGLYEYKQDENWSKVVTGVGSSAPAFNWTEATGLMDDGQWHHLAASFDETSRTITVYLDGKKAAVHAYPTDGSTQSSYEKTAIGGHLYTDGSFSEGFVGALDDLFVVPRALSESDITYLMEHNCLMSPATGVRINAVPTLLLIISGGGVLLCCVGRRSRARSKKA